MANWGAPLTLLKRTPQPLGDELFQALSAQHDQAAAVRRQLERLWVSYRDLATSHWYTEFPRHTQSRFWEMYLAVSLREAGLSLARLPDNSPDVRTALVDGRHCWFEAVAVGAGDLSNADHVSDFPARRGGPIVAERVPEEQILLRLTGGIRAKRIQRAKQLRQRIIGRRDPYVIAINCGAIPRAWFSGQFPWIVKAVFPIGHQFATFDVQTREIADTGWTSRLNISRVNDQKVATQLFASPRGLGISAIVYSSTHLGRLCTDEDIICGDDLVLVHNPFALNPLPRGFLGRGEEWHARLEGDEVVVERLA